jgi:hypothetical protein
MRIVNAAVFLCLLGIAPVSAANVEEAEFSNTVKAALVFRDDFDASRHYPHVLRVFLRLQNVHDAAVTWTANSIAAIEAELLDKDGKPVPMPPQAVNFPSSDLPFLLPFGSRLNWLITHGGVTMTGDRKDKYALMVGAKGWLIPKETLSDYSLRIRLRGVPWNPWSSIEDQGNAKLLLDVPPTRIDLPRDSTTIAIGPWSKPVTDDRGYAVRGRLVLCEKRVADQRDEVVMYVELQDASEHVRNSMRLYCEMGKSDLRPEYKGGLQCELRDKNHRLVEPQSYPFGGASPRSEWVTLPADAAIRLRASPFGVHRLGAMAITPHLNKLWVIADDDANEYFLAGTFTVAPADEPDSPGKEHVWRGTIELPPVRIAGRHHAQPEK